MNKEKFCGSVLTLLLMGMLNFVFTVQPVEASGTIYIRVDGSIDPPTAPIQRIGDTYKFANDIFNESIVVQRDHIKLDGNGHKLQSSLGLDNYVGIDISYRHEVTVTSLVISGFYYAGILLESSHHNKITQNSILSCNVYGVSLSESSWNLLSNNIVMNTNDSEAISLFMSDHNNLYSNRVTNNDCGGLMLYFSTNTTLKNNVMAANKYNFGVWGYSLGHYINDVDVSNTVDGKPVYYWINRQDETVPPNAGVVIIVNSSDIIVKNLVLENNSMGLTLAYTKDSLIEGVTARRNRIGVLLDHSDSNTIMENKIDDSGDGGGISLVVSNNNYVTDNSVSDTDSSGIWLEDTFSNTVTNNVVVDSRSGNFGQEFDGAGILVDDSQSCEVRGNNLTGNLYGIVVGATPATDNLVVENDVVMSPIGLVLGCTAGNILYHNNFMDNQLSAFVWMIGNVNFLDNGYPSGGNYWSDYIGWDSNGDGIGDTPYVLDQNNRDSYPLMSPYGRPPLPTFTLIIESSIGGITDPPPGNYPHSKGQKIPVEARPNLGYVFDHWELDNINMGSPNTTNVTMDSNHRLHALFAVETYQVIIKAHCNAQGTDVGVGITMDGATTGYITPHTFAVQSGAHTFTVPAFDSMGHPFKQWNTGQNGTTITVSSGGICTAAYDVRYALTITSTLGGNTNPKPDIHSYWSGTPVCISTTPDNGYYLDYCQLDGINIGAPDNMHVKMDKNHTLHAAFKQLGSGHDVAIKHIDSKTAIGQGCSSNVKVKAVNVGGYKETFNVTIYVNAAYLGSQTVTLESGSSTIISHTWNTAGFAKGNYTISAYAIPVPGETDTIDNSLIDGWVIVAMIGDITGSGGIPDGKCDIRDMALVARGFGANQITDPASSKYCQYWHSVPCGGCLHNPNCDITGPTIGVPDGKIDIRDIATTAIRFGQIDP